MEAEKFETSPILFGDFMKMGADPADRIYEELVDISKVKNLLADVSLLASPLSNIVKIYLRPGKTAVG